MYPRQPRPRQRKIRVDRQRALAEIDRPVGVRLRGPLAEALPLQVKLKAFRVVAAGFVSTFSNSSDNPSAKYSFSSSRLMLTNGSTAIDGVSLAAGTACDLSGGKLCGKSGWQSWNTDSGRPRSFRP